MEFLNFCFCSSFIFSRTLYSQVDDVFFFVFVANFLRSLQNLKRSSAATLPDSIFFNACLDLGFVFGPRRFFVWCDD